MTEVVSGIRPRPITDPYINSTHNKGDLLPASHCRLPSRSCSIFGHRDWSRGDHRARAIVHPLSIGPMDLCLLRQGEGG